MPSALDDFLLLDRFADEIADGADVLLQGAPDGLVFVGVDHGADAFVGEDFGEERLVDPAVDDVDPADAVAAGADAVFEFRDHVLGNLGLVFLEEFLGLDDGNLADGIVVLGEAVAIGDENELRRLERLGDFHRDAVGVDAEGAAVAVEAERRDDGDDALVEKLVEKFGVDPLDPAGEELVDAADDAEGMGDDGVGVGGAQVAGGEALEHLVGDAVGGGEGELQRLLVGDAGAVGVADRDAGVFASSWIWWAAPCTMTSRMLSERSTARSSMILGKLSSAMMAPSRAITKVFSRKPGM